MHKHRAQLHMPIGFLRSHTEGLADEFYAMLKQRVETGVTRVVEADVRLFVTSLPWDSDYFGCPFFRIDFIEWDANSDDLANRIASTILMLKRELAARHGRYYLFAEVPTEDAAFLQGLGLAGCRLVETRLTYFLDDVQAFTWPERYGVRDANKADLSNLKDVARQSRNAFDRYHADPFFSQTVADDYLATFVENSVKGFADWVLIPSEGGAAGAFFTANTHGSSATKDRFGRIVLVAVGKERQGWHIRLLVEMTQRFKECGLTIGYMTTQATNRAVIRNCEKVGYRYGRTTHVFSAYD